MSRKTNDSYMQKYGTLVNYARIEDNNRVQAKLDAAEALRGALSRTLQVISIIEDDKCIQIASRLNNILSEFDAEFYHKD